MQKFIHCENFNEYGFQATKFIDNRAGNRSITYAELDNRVRTELDCKSTALHQAQSDNAYVSCDTLVQICVTVQINHANAQAGNESMTFEQPELDITNNFSPAGTADLFTFASQCCNHSYVI